MPATTARTGLSRATIYAKLARNDFPRPVKLGPRAIGFLESEIEEWLAERVRNRDAHFGPANSLKTTLRQSLGSVTRPESSK
jgi:prophage regulatory protein